MYEALFDRIIEEENEFIDEDNPDAVTLPRFGCSTSDYDEVRVHCAI